MIGKASEIKIYLIDARELNEWLEKHPETNIIDIQFAMAGITSTGILPHVLIIYKEVTQ